MDESKDKSFSELTVFTNETLSKGVLKLLKHTILGTLDKLRYQHTEVEKKIQLLKHLQFIEIKKRNRFLGTAAVVNRTISLNQVDLRALYIRYLSVHVPNRSSKNLESAENTKPNSRSNIRSKIANVFTQELEKSFRDTNQKGLFYAYVESDNILSKNLCSSFGFKGIRTVLTLLFSQFSAKLNSNVSTLEPKNLASFKSNFEEFYADHNFVFTDYLEDHGTCFTYKIDTESVAEIRAISVKCKIV